MRYFEMTGNLFLGKNFVLWVRMILFDLGETQSRRSRPGSLPTLAVCAVLGLFAACVQRL